jgi:hypothetical protein
MSVGIPEVEQLVMVIEPVLQQLHQPHLLIRSTPVRGKLRFRGKSGGSGTGQALLPLCITAFSSIDVTWKLVKQMVRLFVEQLRVRVEGDRKYVLLSYLKPYSCCSLT